MVQLFMVGALLVIAASAVHAMIGLAPYESDADEAQDVQG